MALLQAAPQLVRNVILVGHVLDELKKIPDNSVHCVVTSPPYWNLRDYGTDAQVWGGDPSCIHAWGQSAKRSKRGGSGYGSSTLTNGGQSSQKANHTSFQTGSRCDCGAWRGELGLEPTPQEFIDHLVLVFREIRRILHPSGVCWVNLGDSYATSGGASKGDAGEISGRKHASARAGLPKTPPSPGIKPKDLVGIPWMAAFALRADGWWLRCDVIWSKPNPMPESTKDRPTRSHEYVFLLTKSERYYYDADAIKEPFADSSIGRYDLANRRNAQPIRSLQAFDVDGQSLGEADAAPHETPPARYKGGQGRVKQREGVAGVDSLVVGGPARRAPGANRDMAPQPGEPGSFGEGGRNKRSVWTIPTQPFSEAHFATFPEEIVEPCIKAGSSERGCCAACGNPWMRMTSVEYETLRESGNWAWRMQAADGQNRSPGMTKYGAARKYTTTHGWAPTCACDAESVPCVVLDPFFGSGTTGLVARRLGRDWIGTELKQEYADMAMRRLAPVMNHRLNAWDGK